mmetsp:Transcript_59945/g.195770  ORF Transcript_59945/g.195770 Transcript_59945/m.195770 type:complete len:788 (+) Transcript_59945:137-2500(+)
MAVPVSPAMLPGRPPVVVQQSPVVTYTHVTARRRSSAEGLLDAPTPGDLLRATTDASQPRPVHSASPSPQWQPQSGPPIIPSPLLRPSSACASPLVRPCASPIVTWQHVDQRRPSIPPGIASASQPQTWVGKSPLLRAAVPVASVPTTYQVSSGAHKPHWATLSKQEMDMGVLPGAEAGPTGSIGGSSHTSGQDGGPSGACGSGGAPSAVLAAAVQLAAAASVGPEDAAAVLVLESSDVVGVPASPLLAAALAPGNGRRPRWASMTEDDMRRLPTGSPLLQASPVVWAVVPGTPSPHLAPAVAWPPAAMTSGWALPGGGLCSSAASFQGQARRRWASVSDDEAASPMMWPQRSPLHRSHRSSSQPLVGPGAAGGSGPSAMTASAQPFMLPQAHGPAGMQSGLMDPHGSSWGQHFVGNAGGCVQPATGAWAMGRQTMWGPSAAMAQQWGMPGGAGPPMMQAGMAWSGGVCVGTACMPMACNLGAMMSSGGERAMRALNGLTVVWVGERAFRAPAVMKEQIEGMGFLVKIYRSHDKCSRALDKKATVASTNVFVVSEGDGGPLLKYLKSREARHIQFVVDAEHSTNPIEAQRLTMHPAPDESSVAVAFTWDDVLLALQNVSMLASPQAMGGIVMMGGGGDVESVAGVASGMSPVGRGDLSVGETGVVSDSPWTLVWVSDQAFKPAAGAQKTKLEALGCQVKGYKTHKNAARALDKKRVLVRTVVLVSGAEAPPFLAYLTSRPEIAATPVVVEASSRSVPVRESSICKVVDSFEAAIEAVGQMAADPGFA